MSGRTPKIKGSRVEREIVNALKDCGIPAFRVPLSGAGAIYGKSGSGFQTLEKWMGDCDVLILKRDRQQPMVCMDWNLFVSLMGHEVEQGE